jgi:hypothetical protein
MQGQSGCWRWGRWPKPNGACVRARVAPGVGKLISVREGQAPKGLGRCGLHAGPGRQLALGTWPKSNGACVRAARACVRVCVRATQGWKTYFYLGGAFTTGQAAQRAPQKPTGLPLAGRDQARSLRLSPSRSAACRRELLALSTPSSH